MGELKPYSQGILRLDLNELTGKLIVLEGTDGVGRSTQISLIRLWLESNGMAVLDTAMTDSQLTGAGLKEAKEGHTLGPATMTLFYATDFVDRLENVVIPALKAGFVVLTDRYIYSLIARAAVRGMDTEWLEGIFSIALKPDLSIYLKTDLETLIPRVLHSTGFDYWESGMDLHLGDSLFDSFCEYQKRLIDRLDTIAAQNKFAIVDASKGIEEVFEDIKVHLKKLLEEKPTSS